MEFLGLSTKEVAILTLIVEIIFITLLFTGWIYGSRRLNIRFHHMIVYPLIVLNIVIVSFQMLLPSLDSWDYLFSNIFKGINPIGLTHRIFGLITITMTIVITLTFLLDRQLQLKTLKRARPVMFATITTWTVTFICGCVIFWNKYLKSNY
ncbi:MAG: hypothetical protein ACFFCQ_17535 [Promethearchaeota archaeon]